MSAAAQPWNVHFLKRHKDDDPAETVPVIEFFDQLPDQLVARFHAVLDAVAEAPPPSFAGGGYWEAMHGDMGGYYEIRILGPGRTLHRLFCVLDNRGTRLGGPSIVCLCGMSKRRGSSFSPRDYRRVRTLGAEFKRRRSVLR